MLEMVYMCEWKHGENHERGEKSALGEVLLDTPFVQLLLLEFDVLLEEDTRYASTELEGMSTEDVINKSKLYSKDAEVRFPGPTQYFLELTTLVLIAARQRRLATRAGS